MKLLNANQLKIIAAVSMFLDHLGYYVLPNVIELRYIGRIAYPIFAFFIAEGCIHTRNFKKYFARISILGLVCMLVTYVYAGEIYGNILITFSLSLVVIRAIEFATQIPSYMERAELKVVLKIVFFALIMLLILFLCELVEIDYGFFGIMVPVLCWIFERNGKKQGLTALGIGLLILSVTIGGYQILCLLSLAFIALYNHERGRAYMKNFFYWFYPGHIVFLQTAALVVS